ncbi:MAG: hypothetical protein Q9195_002852 [Heterodermia aff. obscurata]
MVDPFQYNFLFSLSPELIDKVARELDHKTRLNAPLVCKVLSHYATSLVFEKLHVWLEETSISNLVRVALEPHLRMIVKTIIVSIDEIYDLSFSQFESYIHPHGLISEPQQSDNDRTSARRAAWLAYQKLYQENHDLMKSGRATTMLQTAFTAFKALTRIDLIDFQSWVPRYAEEFGVLKAITLIDRSMLTVPNHGFTVPRGRLQLHMLLRTLAAANSTPNTLLIRIETQNIGVEGFYDPLSIQTQSFAREALAGLRKLHLVLDPIPQLILAEMREFEEESSLTSLLKAATNLEVLSLELPILQIPKKAVLAGKTLFKYHVLVN